MKTGKTASVLPRSHTQLYTQNLCRDKACLLYTCQIFNDKTVAALSTLKDKLGINEGTIIFVKLITDWFHMMNVKDRYSGINMRNECRQPWTSPLLTLKT
ncbi:unnamed protein product [Clavelina lepadiformis]|uniref:Uncharacterized protein n=1 Tax=Clavelina lepadiformis TaxID=159417 RepID=A0ABP0G091_CLALP